MGRWLAVAVGSGCVLTLGLFWWAQGVDPTSAADLLPVVVVVLGVVITLLAGAVAGVSTLGQARSRRISEQMGDRLEAREHMLEQSNKEVERFATIAAHDLQEPLRTILTFTDLIERRWGDELDSDARNYLLRVAAAAFRMRALIEDLLTYARIGQAERRFEVVDLDRVVAEVQENLSQLIDETNAHIVVGDLPTVVGNPQGLAQVLSNLLSNGMKYRMGDPEIKISAVQKGKEWVISVADNGKGIDPQNHERIFELFRRLEPRGVSGTGLGLAICARVVDVHGGRIWVRSQVGKGATFTFTIPVRSVPKRSGR
jgi:light-regulated signal transduction histidine kinase (bacteriophytochrome)